MAATVSAPLAHTAFALRATDAAGPATRAVPEFFLDRPEGRIAYSDEGSGPLVVMVPGLGDLKEEYRFLAPAVAAAGYRVVTMDLRGHGRSSVGWTDYTSAALGSDIVALLDRLAAGPAILVGTSMGAAAAAWAAAEAPAEVGGLVLIGPFVRDTLPQSRLQGLLMKLMIKAAFAGPWARAAWGRYYDSLYQTRKPDDFAAYRAALMANLGEPGRLAATRAMMNASKADVAARLHEVRAPTLVVMGSKDPDFPDASAEAGTVAELLGGTIAMVEGAGHYPHAEMPEATAPAVLAFLAERAAR